MSGSVNKANLTTTANAVAYFSDTTGTFASKASANGALYATSANGALSWGTLPAAQGGTGQTSLQATRNAMGLGNTTGALPVANGGTGATTAASARTNLGLGTMATEAAANYIAKSTLSGAFDVMYSSAANTPARLAANTTTTAKVLSMTGTGSAGAAPAWKAIGAHTYTYPTGATSRTADVALNTSSFLSSVKSAGAVPTLGDAIAADDITAWSAGTLPTLGTAIAADDITSWSAGTMFTATVSGEVLTFTAGTAPSLGYTAKSIPNVTGVGTLPSLTYTARSIPNVTAVGSMPTFNTANAATSVKTQPTFSVTTATTTLAHSLS